MTRQDGFTLIEVMVAIAILAVVVTTMLALRSEALIDAAEARNWRIARDIAEHYLSELRAGAREFPPESREIVAVEGYPEFEYQIVIGETHIGEVESDLADTADAGSSSDDGPSSTSRQNWQREREQLRRAQSSGVTLSEYEDQLAEEELEEKIPSEDELEEVAVVVYFPNIRPGDDSGPDTLHFMLKAKISTMALQGLTPDRAAIIAEQRGEGTEEAATGSPVSGLGR